MSSACRRLPRTRCVRLSRLLHQQVSESHRRAGSDRRVSVWEALLCIVFNNRRYFCSRVFPSARGAARQAEEGRQIITRGPAARGPSKLAEDTWKPTVHEIELPMGGPRRVFHCPSFQSSCLFALEACSLIPSTHYIPSPLPALNADSPSPTLDGRRGRRQPPASGALICVCIHH